MVTYGLDDSESDSFASAEEISHHTEDAQARETDSQANMDVDGGQGGPEGAQGGQQGGQQGGAQAGLAGMNVEAMLDVLHAPENAGVLDRFRTGMRARDEAAGRQEGRQAEEAFAPLLAYLRGQGAGAGAGPAPARTMKWPIWEGHQEDLDDFLLAVQVKVDLDRGVMPDRALVMSIQQQMPRDKRANVSDWIQREATRDLAPGEERWNPHRFIAHIASRCGDPLAAVTARRQLSLFRQGRYQPFGAFLQEYEVLAGKAEVKGAAWPNERRIEQLR